MASIEVPEWFNPELLPLLEEKLDRSKMKQEERRLDWVVRQVLKAMPSGWTGIDTTKFAWKDIEQMVAANCWAVFESWFEPDLVIGIKSGGAFIADYVAKYSHISEVDYMKISHYSSNSRSVVKSTINSYNKKAVIKEEPKVVVEDRKIILVDDQVGTGSTFEVGKAYLHNKNAKDVRTFCLYSRGPKVDFCLRKGMMIYTPRGKDP